MRGSCEGGEGEKERGRCLVQFLIRANKWEAETGGSESERGTKRWP